MSGKNISMILTGEKKNNFKLKLLKQSWKKNQIIYLQDSNTISQDFSRGISIQSITCSSQYWNQ